MLIDRERRVYHLNLSSAEVFVQNGRRWDAPPWWELPAIVRDAVARTLQR